MLRISSHIKFDRAFKKRITPNPKLQKQFISRFELFKYNRLHPFLRDHQLTGSMSRFRAFSINGDIRVIYQRIDDNTVIFIDIGTHNQVY